MFKEGYLNVSKEDLEVFDNLYAFIKLHSLEEICNFCVVNVKYKELVVDKKIYTIKNELDGIIYAKTTTIGCFRTAFVGGATLWQWVNELKDNIDEYNQIYQMLEDEQSRITFMSIILFRLFNEEDYLKRVYQPLEYFQKELLPKRENAVYVDCGAYKGDTAIGYRNVYGQCKKMYLFEPAPDNYALMVKNTQSFEEAVQINKATSDKAGEMSFSSHLPDAANRLAIQGSIKVQVTSLDEEIKEPVTFIKMDIEGAEMDAIYGARRHIIEEKPQLALCVYHLVSDMRKIPLTIYGMNRNQKFYLRYHGIGVPEEIVFYANPMGEAEIDEQEIQEKLIKLSELMDTIQEGLDYSSVQIRCKNYRDCVTMFDDIKTAYEVCYNLVDEIQKNIE